MHNVPDFNLLNAADSLCFWCKQGGQQTSQVCSDVICGMPVTAAERSDHAKHYL